MGDVLSIIIFILTEILLGLAPTLPPTPAPTRPPVPPTPNGSFNIRLINVGTVTAFDGIFQAAANRWMELIVGDLPDIPAGAVDDWFGDFFGARGAFNGPVDDVVIGYEFTDLPGTVIGSAGPRFVRSSDGTTIAGIMQFDSEFFFGASTAANSAVILHEMGHVLGIGTRWDNVGCDNGCAVDGRTFFYNCGGAINAYRALNLGELGTPNLQIESEGGSGSACGHWDDASFNSPVWTELFIFFIDSRRVQLITTVTLGTLTDIGAYTVNFAAADPIPDPSTNIVNYGSASDTRIDLSELIEDVTWSFFDDRRILHEVKDGKVDPERSLRNANDEGLV